MNTQGLKLANEWWMEGSVKKYDDTKKEKATIRKSFLAINF
jgi:hypothetical protein